MEMHQVRYFLAAVSELNFTKAAEKCNVAQPSLTRAIKQLEAELGGDLFRRERPQAQLTDLGQRMLPLLKQCYDSAVGARSLASAIKGGEVGSRCRGRSVSTCSPGISPS
jgi:DNA-binding transcriptional LysR family regulator